MDFTELGLTKNESMVFETIVRLGKAGSSMISKESGVSYSRIYDILSSLEHKGLVKIVPEKGKKFIPGDPGVLKSLIENKRKVLTELDEEVGELKAIYTAAAKEAVEIARGKRNFYKLVREMSKPKKSEYNIKYSSEYNPIWEREKRGYLKKGIEIKELVRVDKESIDNIKTWLNINKNIKEIPNKGVAISIVDDSEILIALIKSNTIIIIRDSPFVKLMSELFKSYYNHAENLKL